MAKHFIKAGIPVADLYETVNELSGITGESEQGEPVYKPKETFGQGEEISVEGGVVSVTPGTIVNADTKNGFIKVTCTYADGSFKLQSKPIGDGHIYFIAPKDYTAGETFYFGDTQITSVSYMNGELLQTNDFKKDMPVYAFLSGNKLVFKGGGGVSGFKLSGATAEPSHVLQGKTFYSAGSKDTKQPQTGTIPLKSAATYYAKAADQTISPNQYLSGAQTIKGITQSNLAAGNVKKGVRIAINNGQSDVYAVTGTYDPSKSFVLYACTGGYAGVYGQGTWFSNSNNGWVTRGGDGYDSNCRTGWNNVKVLKRCTLKISYDSSGSHWASDTSAGLRRNGEPVEGHFSSDHGHEGSHASKSGVYQATFNAGETIGVETPPKTTKCVMFIELV